MKKLLVMMLLVLVGAVTWSCKYNDDDIWNAVEDLNSKVEAMDKAVKQANTDLISLRSIVEALQKDITIKSVIEGENDYTVTFSDGKTITIANGKGGNVPKISVIKGDDGLYYWAIDGKILESDGVKIRAQGTDGITPQLRINETTKEWEISLDGETWTSMGVKADGKEGDSIFKSVKDGENDVVFELRDGSKIVLPKGASSVFRFVMKEDCAYELFGFGQKKEIPLSVVNIAAADYMNVPLGWDVEFDLEKKVAKVTAPLYSGTNYTEGIISLIGIDNQRETIIASAKVCAVNFLEPKGAYVLNEGNFSTENGSLIFIMSTGKVIDRVYYRANGTELGHTTQDLFSSEGKIYIISQNGNKMDGDGTLVVADLKTMEKVAAYNEELSALSMPTHIAVIGNIAYIRDNNGIHCFNMETKALSLVEGTKGASMNRMAVIGNKVFAAAGKKVMVIENGALVKSIELAGTVSGIVKSSDKNIWVSCTTSPARILKLNAADYSMVSHELPDEYKLGAGWGSTPAITAKDNLIYFCNAGNMINRHNFETDKTVALTDVKKHIANFGMLYNNPAVHPVTGEVYYTSIKGYGMDYLVNDIVMFDFSDSSPFMVEDFQNYTRFPAGVFFILDYYDF